MYEGLVSQRGPVRNAPGPSESIGSNIIGGVEGAESVVWLGPAM